MTQRQMLAVCPHSTNTTYPHRNPDRRSAVATDQPHVGSESDRCPRRHGAARARSQKPKAVSAAAGASPMRERGRDAWLPLRPVRACAAAVGSVLKPMPRARGLRPKPYVGSSGSVRPSRELKDSRRDWVGFGRAFLVPRCPRRSPKIRQRNGGRAAEGGVRALVWDRGKWHSHVSRTHGNFGLLAA